MLNTNEFKHEAKECPRCGNVFECKVGNIAECQCRTVTLNQEELDYLRDNFEDCLCAECMKLAKVEYHNEQHQSRLKRILGVFYRKPKV